MNAIINEITQDQLQPERENFKVGDGVRVHTRVREGDKERIQIFSGIVISRKGTGVQESFTVRRIASGGGVEKVVEEVMAANREEVEQVKTKPKAMGWFVGQVMKATGGKANPATVNEILRKKLDVAE